MSAKEYTEWAKEKGVKINGVVVKDYGDRGFGLVVTEYRLKEYEVVLFIPNSTLMNITTVPTEITKAISNTLLPISVNGILAYDLLTTSTKNPNPWTKALPREVDLLPTLPFTWASELQALLPLDVLFLLQKQNKRVAQDWAAVEKAFPETEYHQYIYNWFLISTRTFYFTPPAPKKKFNKAKNKKIEVDPDDCITMTPFADLFNHTSEGSCSVNYGSEGYQVVMSETAKRGDELSISYGNHSNDFLLAEYGFILPLNNNKWDQITIDPFLVNLFSDEECETLKENKYWGKWILDADGICYRTRVAVSLLILDRGKWERMVAAGEEGDETIKREVDRKVYSILRPQLDIAGGMPIKIDACKGKGTEKQRNVLKARWCQIENFLSSYCFGVEKNDGEFVKANSAVSV